MSEKRLIDYAKLEEYRGTLNQYVDTIWNSLEPAREFIQSELDKKAEEVIGYIAEKEGWEETEDIYRKHFGFKQKYIRSEVK